MTRYDLIVRNGDVITADGARHCDIGIIGQHIAAVEPDLGGTYAAEIDARNALVLPGVVDPHVHFNEPGRAHWEGWVSGSAALAAGGGTTCIEMPLNAHPPTLTRRALDHKIRVASAKSFVDFALWGGLTPDNLEHLPDLALGGVIGFKAFMSNSGIDDFAHADDDTLFRGMTIAAKLGLPVAVHAENDTMTTALARQARALNRITIRDYLDSRPVEAELEAISRAIRIAAETHASLHVVHVSTGDGVALIAEARAKGVDVSCETCPHYLICSENNAISIGPLAKCAPPLRDVGTRRALRQALERGDIDFLGSDHSPAPPSMKQSEDAFANWGGISGCQHLLPVMLTETMRGTRLQDLPGLTSSHAASRFGLTLKGEIVAGRDADLAIVSPQHPAPIPIADVLYRHPHSIWDECAMGWRVEHTVLRGQPVMRDGKAINPSRGQHVRPSWRMRHESG